MPYKRQELNQLFALNRKVFKAYLLKESLDRLWTYHYEGVMLNYLERWIDQLRWQRLEPFQKLAEMLLDHLEGILKLLPHQGSSRGSGGRKWEHQGDTRTCVTSC
jgi:transposase